MGYKWTIEVWGQDEWGYRDMEFWAGEWLIPALFYMCKAKRMGYGCVRLAWR